jgi:hypothetical protein
VPPSPDEDFPPTPPVKPVDPVLPVDTEPSIRTKPIVSSIPDEGDKITIPLITPTTPLVVPEIPKEKTGIVEVSPLTPGEIVPEEVGPKKGGGGDLPEDFDKYLVPDGTTPAVTATPDGGAVVTLPDTTSGTSDLDNRPTGGGLGGGKGNLEDYYDIEQVADGGLLAAHRYAMGGMNSSGGISDLGGYSDGGRLLKGPGDGVSDSIPAMIGRKQPARLADGEFVIPARIVSELGNGSTDAGARKLYQMMDRIQAARKRTTGKNHVAVNSRADKMMPV